MWPHSPSLYNMSLGTENKFGNSRGNRNETLQYEYSSLDQALSDYFDSQSLESSMLNKDKNAEVLSR